ncbi:MAG TPA: glycosyltransferase [Puia sp.]|jgi:glycosyltransferase involved in cell wall biosynthesis|nr:glycosyltransferase [Puia sp.]
MRVAIFETEHFEGAYPVIKLFDDGVNSITIFTYERSYRQFNFLFGENMKRYEWIVKNENGSKNNFILRMYKEIKKRKIELLYLNTVSNNFHSYALLIKMLKRIRIIVTIHNINEYFEFNKAETFRQKVRRSGKKILIKEVKEFNVVSLTMVENLKRKLPAHKKVHCVPGAIFEKEKIEVADLADGEKIKIVVAGTIDVRRRNYKQVFEFLDKCIAIQLPVTVTLLGGYYGEEGKKILENCEEYSLKHDDLKFYNSDVVDQPEFDRVMNEAHFVWIPSVIETILQDNVTEVYGVTISSGNLFDIIKHAKPFIVPEQLQFDSYLNSSSFKYQHAGEITEYLQKFITDSSLYNKLKEKALINSENYTIENVKARNKDLFSV